MTFQEDKSIMTDAESHASSSAECLKGANDFETIGSWEKAGLTMDKQDPHELGDDANERAPEWPIGPDAIKIESVAMEKRAG